jgi:signal transduction histidine kinase
VNGPQGAARAGRPFPAELAIALVIVGLTFLTLVVLLSPRVAPAAVNTRLALSIDATATLVATAVAILAWIHFREGRDPAALLRGSALVALGALNALYVVATVAGIEGAFGLSLDDAGQLPLWSTAAARSVAVVLFVLAGLAALRGWSAGRWPAALVLWLPGLAVVAATVLLAAFQVRLPALVPVDAIRRLASDPAAPLDSANAGWLIAWQVAIAIGFLAAAALSYRVYRRDGRTTDAILTVALVIPAFAQLLFSIHPGTYASLVSAGDILRVAFYGALFLQVGAEARGDVRALHEANAELVRLREIEVERATAEERARLAREIHDGMSQELWYAKLKQGRLTAMDDLPSGARELADEVGVALEAAISEARQAILALRPSDGATFAQVLDRYVGDYADRFGIAAESWTDPATEQLGTRSQAELLRIVQEALTNAHRHADATRVRVRLERVGRGLRLLVADNGRGFEADALRESGYGLRSMRERAEIIGAELRIESRPSDGTRVTVDIPLPESRA